MPASKGSLQALYIAPYGFEAPFGGLPVSSSTTVQPSAQMSEVVCQRLCSIASGATACAEKRQQKAEAAGV